MVLAFEMQLPDSRHKRPAGRRRPLSLAPEQLVLAEAHVCLSVADHMHRRCKQLDPWSFRPFL